MCVNYTKNMCCVYPTYFLILLAVSLHMLQQLQFFTDVIHTMRSASMAVLNSHDVFLIVVS